MKLLEASTGERSGRGREKGDRRKEPVYSHDTG
jgi:hypothetical protein